MSPQTYIEPKSQFPKAWCLVHMWGWFFFKALKFNKFSKFSDINTMASFFLQRNRKISQIYTRIWLSKKFQNLWLKNLTKCIGKKEDNLTMKLKLVVHFNFVDVFESMAPHFGNVPIPWALSSIIKHKNEWHHKLNHMCIRKLRRGGFLVLTPIP
jgi:hypothetical protein